MKIFRPLSALLLLMFTTPAFAQTKYNGPVVDTMKLFIFQGKPMVYLPTAPGKTFFISRAIGDSTQKYTMLTLPGRAKSMSAFKKAAGTPVVDSLKNQLKLKTDEALWDYLNAHPDFKDYGVIALNINFLKAMGFVFIDDGVKGLKPGTPVYYRLGITDEGAPFLKARFVAGSSVVFDKPAVFGAVTQDTVMMIKWGYIKKAKSSLPAYAYVYRKIADATGFEQLKTKAGVITHGDTVLFKVSDQVKQGVNYTYFIRLADIFDNVSNRSSDTARVIAVDYALLPKLTNVIAKDTANGVMISWKALAAGNSLVAGIEIERSKNIAAGYIKLDTVAATSSNYTDQKATPGQTYYYRVHTLGLNKNSSADYSGFVSATHMDKNAPAAPYHISASTQTNGVKVSWSPVKGVIGYYIYRSDANTATEPQVISGMLADTATQFIDVTKNRSRRTDYYYTVKAINYAGVESAFSAAAAAKLPIGVDKISIPGGLRLQPTDGKMLLQWEDVKPNDMFVTGYHVYKRISTGKTSTFDGNTPAATTAKSLGFVLITKDPTRIAQYEDETITGDTLKYDYAIASVDAYGVESGLSSIASTSYFATSATVKRPVELFARKALTGVEIRWIPADAKALNNYVIYRRSATETVPRKIALVKNGTETYVDKTAIAKNMYIYLVKTIANNVESEAGAEKAVRVD